MAYREIPYNYTSADDQTIVQLLFGQQLWQNLETLRDQRITGRTARLIFRFIGDQFIYFRNPYLYQELISSLRFRRKVLKEFFKDLTVVKNNCHDPVSQKVWEDLNLHFLRFKKEVHTTSLWQKKLTRIFGSIIGKENVSFSPYDLVAHATDATDWRLHLPLAVLRPSNPREVSELVRAARKLKLKIIPRGGGTGLTGGAVPLHHRCLIINTEKLNKIGPLEEKIFTTDAGHRIPAMVLTAGAGVLTETAMEHAHHHHRLFATDPTSAWASTIGGNVSENAGGKSAVHYGTAIDNLVSYSMVFPDGSLQKISRINHPFRKILPQDTVQFQITDPGGQNPKIISLRSDEIRKKNLGKDVTNKALGGLPGIQKEGTDGIIVEAQFILYPLFPQEKTLCLEFFGDSLDEAAMLIEKISQHFPLGGPVALMAMEHFDEQYIKAIQYRIKALRDDCPKAVVLIDLAAHTESAITEGIKKIGQLLQPFPNAVMHLAKDSGEAKLFWQDRKKFGVIAARTNAFKLNEDIVIPISALAEFTRFYEKINQREAQYTAAATITAISEYLKNLPLPQEKLFIAQKICQSTDRPLPLVEHLSEFFNGEPEIVQRLQEIYRYEQARIIIIATHMHAGDGNIHVNIPVFSNDRPMMNRAQMVVDEVAVKAQELGGVVSGEHGIGITKIQYIAPEILLDLKKYRQQIDPDGMMNPEKLANVALSMSAFTPSFNLLELEARILKHGHLDTLMEKISPCVRCGKCKQNCCVFYPEKNLFYHPRDKNLAVSSVFEALLYNAQRERSASFQLLKNLEDIADHCTICHKCKIPCPVNIDTGEVSIMERQVLAARRFKRTPLITTLTLQYLSSTSKFFNTIFRPTVLTLGSFFQRQAHYLLAPLKLAPALLKTPAVAPTLRTARAYLPKCENNQALILTPVTVANTVLYFPGCGSERLFSDIALAAIYLLLRNNIQVILPPPYLCCGLPSRANAKVAWHEKIVLRDSIILSQIREMLNYLEFGAVVVTCGTCQEELDAAGVPELFKTKTMDVLTYLQSRGFKLNEVSGNYLYHAPCHDTFKGLGPKLIKDLTSLKVESVPHCCSQAGTMAISRPDISHLLYEKKCQAFDEISNDGQAKSKRIFLTNCPSCLQGLGKNSNYKAQHVAVELCRLMEGNHWKDSLKKLYTHDLVTF
jgi:FAD/FMN-containing dehydrogenase/Fe-S oxidoreductase